MIGSFAIRLELVVCPARCAGRQRLGGSEAQSAPESPAQVHTQPRHCCLPAFPPARCVPANTEPGKKGVYPIQSSLETANEAVVFDFASNCMPCACVSQPRHLQTTPNRQAPGTGPFIFLYTSSVLANLVHLSFTPSKVVGACRMILPQVDSAVQRRRLFLVDRPPKKEEARLAGSHQVS